jgi:cytoskeletal protein RodZ
MVKWHQAPTAHREQSQAEHLAEIGAVLRQHRESQGLTLEQVESTTKIQKRQLLAIESGQIDRLPEPVYIRAFITRFAEAIGLSGSELAHQYPVQRGDSQSHNIYLRTLALGQLRPIHLYALYVCVILSAVSSLSSILERSTAAYPGDLLMDRIEVQSQPSTTLQPRTNILASQVAAQPLREAFPLAGFSPPSRQTLVSTGQELLAQFPAAPNSPKPVQIKLTLLAQSWLRVVVDGKTAFEGMMLEGSQQTWQGKEQITIRAGDAGQVMVTYNNQPPQQLGEPGAVKQVTYEAEESLALLVSP